MNLSEIITAAVTVVPQQLDRGYERFGGHGQALTELLLSFKNWTTFTIAPPLPNIIPLCIFWVGDVLDIVADTFANIPGLIAGNILLDSITLDPWYRQRVMTLEQAVMLVYRVGIDEGLQNFRAAVPRPWAWANAIDRWTKLYTLLETPSFSNLWKFIKKGPWRIIVTIVLYLIMFIKQIGVLMMLWNFSKAVEDTASRNLYFSRALSQDRPRKKVRVRIRRRIGGVPP